MLEKSLKATKKSNQTCTVNICKVGVINKVKLSNTNQTCTAGIILFPSIRNKLMNILMRELRGCQPS